MRSRSKCTEHTLFIYFGVNVNFKQFLGVICAKNLRESGISSPLLGPPYRDRVHIQAKWLNLDLTQWILL